MERKVDAIIIHCSDSPDANEHIDADTIEMWHKERAMTEPWSSFISKVGQTCYIGYHFVVCRDGQTQAARPVEFKGCHCKGYNSSSIGICWVGRSIMTSKQKESLLFLVAGLCIQHGLEAQDVYGHAHFNKQKSCPNFNSKFTFESIDAFRSQLSLAITEMK
jgi:N-acetylmuramoyl-L-alanine amidase